MDFNHLKRGLLHINSLPIGKLIFPREGSPGGCKSPRADGLARGLRGKPMWEHLALAAESDETFPGVSPFRRRFNCKYNKIIKDKITKNNCNYNKNIKDKEILILLKEEWLARLTKKRKDTDERK